jgi:hypothetical protein
MFTILIPATLAPIVVTLYWAQHRAKKLGVLATEYHETAGGPTARAGRSQTPFMKRFFHHVVDVDAFGLLLFAAGWACLLLPLTLVNKGTLTWKSGKIIAMLVVSCSLTKYLVTFGYITNIPLAGWSDHIDLLPLLRVAFGTKAPLPSSLLQKLDDRRLRTYVGRPSVFFRVPSQRR